MHSQREPASLSIHLLDERRTHAEHKPADAEYGQCVTAALAIDNGAGCARPRGDPCGHCSCGCRRRDPETTSSAPPSRRTSPRVERAWSVDALLSTAHAPQRPPDAHEWCCSDAVFGPLLKSHLFPSSSFSCHPISCAHTQLWTQSLVSSVVHRWLTISCN